MLRSADQFHSNSLSISIHHTEDTVLSTLHTSSPLILLGFQSSFCYLQLIDKNNKDADYSSPFLSAYHVQVLCYIFNID